MFTVVALDVSIDVNDQFHAFCETSQKLVVSKNLIFVSKVFQKFVEEVDQ